MEICVSFQVADIVMDTDFEKLEVWKKSCGLSVKVYNLLKSCPDSGLYSQMTRAAVSIPSNIAEGNGRMAIKEQIHFLEIAYGSVMEVYTQLQVAVDLGYITDEDFKAVKPLIFNTSKLISGLRSSKVAKLPH